jgi:hypothetical protein
MFYKSNYFVKFVYTSNKYDMKKHYLLLFGFILSVCNSYSQQDTTKIKVNNQEYYLTTTIGYPVNGIYLYDGKSEPIVQLNPNGTGIFQSKDLSKTNIIWGIETTEKGNLKYNEGFNSAAYTLWYKNNSDTDENWTAVQLSVHYDKKKIFISGERSKEYQEAIK